MKANQFQRILALLLAAALTVYLLPAAVFAAEADDTPTEATQSTTDPPAESTEPAEISGGPTESTAPPVTEPEETIPPETAPEDAAPPAETNPTEAAAEPPGEPEPSEPTEEATEPPTAPEEPTVPTEIELASQVITVDELGIAPLADVTGSLNTKDGLGCDPQNPIQVTYTDALGNSHSTNIRSLKWHYVDQISQPIYCIEPDKSAVDSLGMPGDHVGTEGAGSSNGAIAWYQQLTVAQRRAVGLVLLYGCPNSLWDTTWNTYVSHGNPNAGYRAATQAIIWEFIMGLRSPTAPFDYTSHAQARVFYEQCQGNCMTDGTDNFLYAYEYIIGKLRDHATIPSFTSASQLTIPTHSMTAQADGYVQGHGLPRSGAAAAAPAPCAALVPEGKPCSCL